MNKGCIFQSDRGKLLPAVASILLLIGLTAIIFPYSIKTDTDFLLLLFIPVMLIFLPTLVILLSMFYVGNTFLDGEEEKLMARVILILSLFSIILSIQHELMMFGMTCPHAYSPVEALAHVGGILVASVPSITYAMAVFLIGEKWKYLIYVVFTFSINMAILIILLPYTL